MTDQALHRTADVIIIDDDSASARIVSTFLERNGYVVVTEGNAFAGLNAVRRHRPKVVLLDIQMPGMDGITATGMVKSYAPAAHVVLMSGYREDLGRAGREALGAFAILEKPLPLNALLDFVRGAVA
ncbi:MAG: response regulator [Minwuia sp.]|uniref:response regulator n=1 Tax=Minwuia sp. TaxID=2493630 RepID=UPI003A877C24